LWHFEYDNEARHEILFDEKPPLMRTLMQNYGTDVRRKDDHDYWVKQWVKGSANISNIVTDDIRFKNEAQALRGQGGIIVRLTRPDVETGGDHVSETEQLEIISDYQIACGKGDLDILYNKLDEIISKETGSV
jgi:hypothetical protein